MLRAGHAQAAAFPDRPIEGDGVLLALKAR